mgnify:CR=1 FL=1
MDIFIDNNIGGDQFFISVPINEKDSISFDWTTKGHRVIKQRLKGEQPPPNSEPTMEWDTLYIHDGKFVGKEHVIWYDMGQEDWVNGKIYETIKEWPIDEATAEKLLRYSLIVSDHTAELGKYVKEMQEFEGLLNKLIRMTCGKNYMRCHGS